MLLFIWIALVYVIVAFADVTASTFVDASRGPRPTASRFNPGGAVALAAVTYLALAVVMGLVQRLSQPPLWLLTVVFVPATLGVVWLGTQASTLLAAPARARGPC